MEDNVYLFLVPSEKTPNVFYQVDINKQTCECKDFTYRQRICKHIKSVAKDLNEELKRVQ